MKNFIRMAAAVPELRVGGVSFNCEAILRQYRAAVENGAAVVVFPELAVTGSSCGDLFLQQQLISAAEAGLQKLADAAGDTVMIVGVPLARRGRLFNCAAVLQKGTICGIAVKNVLSNGEKRYFSSAGLSPFSSLPLFETASGNFRFGVEIGSDLFAVTPPSAGLAVSGGAQVIFNPSAMAAVAGRGDFIRETVRNHSARICGGYVFCNAGVHESTADAVYSGQSLIAVNGSIAAENRLFDRAGSVIYTDFNGAWMDQVRCRKGIFFDSAQEDWRSIQGEKLADLPASPDLTCCPVERLPFVPSEETSCRSWCAELVQMQTAALAKRMEHTRMKWVVGLSGGLDSTLALLSAVHCRNMYNFPADSVLAIGMPGFGTSGRTKGNAEKLAEILQVPYRTIPIGEAVAGHFRDIGHDPAVLDVVYENSQARERTQILMDVANGCGGLVLGTGDLSEIALGWCTYNGDHMSMYSINGSIPKTLVRYMVSYYAEILPEAREVLLDILHTPVSPELLPGKQHTEELIGSYELHDFFLYYFVEYGADPATLAVLAERAFPEWSRAQILPVLRKFLIRFFSQQFKRNAMPDGPKIGPVSLSARGDWQMPSDAVMDEWLNSIADGR
ncbi:MAG: NAD(+) synthase [Lentisphaeria bacterium]|nr:NAD(+) synthase [Lentisphaeria bacterium]